ncbi:LCP family protein required for cell wall assembly [Bacillus ectoiniformans]|uniref:LCP family protein n=1 Tax=Bacillus ectoiniformans TaxID=1494429 RepID=UPI00195D282C|nr:LCP family protein [Bacillus ectoiniformans]MBM7649340.1 LCP family protein required for cell wall assembly [Bacillus ectoiniformans]
MSSERQRTQRRKRKKRKRLIAFFLILPLVFIAFTAAGYGAYLYKKAETVFSDSYEDDGRSKSDLRDSAVHPSKDNISILLMGIDDSEVRDFGDDTRTDALMVATLNIKEKSIKLLSIPRDSYVYVPEVDYKTKITHAHAYGGPKVTIETVEELLDIPIDYYVRMNFHAFIDVVEAVDGIEVDVPYKLNEKDSKDRSNAIKLDPGVQELNGEEALALARTRKKDNDIERGKRQQEILQAVIKKAVSVNSIAKYDDVVEAIGSNMRTNMTFNEMKALVNYGSSGNLKTESLSLAGEDARDPSSGAYIYELDETELEVIKRKLKRQLDISYNDDSSSEEDYAADDE